MALASATNYTVVRHTYEDPTAQTRRDQGGLLLWHGDTVFMLFAYPRNKQIDLTPSQARLLRDQIESYTNG